MLEIARIGAVRDAAGGMAFCTKCGLSNEQQARFCNSCGAAMWGVTADNHDRPRSQCANGPPTPACHRGTERD